jgi:hypothetical protein
MSVGHLRLEPKASVKMFDGLLNNLQNLGIYNDMQIANFFLVLLFTVFKLPSLQREGLELIDATDKVKEMVEYGNISKDLCKFLIPHVEYYLTHKITITVGE